VDDGDDGDDDDDDDDGEKGPVLAEVAWTPCAMILMVGIVAA
jgi:hypothetical protein